MTPDLRAELQQRRPFVSAEQEVFLQVERTATVLADGFERMLKPHGITGAQYNVLRILRGAGPDGLCRNEIRGRMVARMPDVTRLLDRMEAAGLIARERSSEDRRQVTTRLTAAGRRLVDRLDAPAAAEHHRTLGHLTRSQLDTLKELLTAARAKA